MKIYLAAQYQRHPEMKAYADTIHKMTKHSVVSKWVNGNHEALDAATSESEKNRIRREIAEGDLADLQSADLLILFSEKVGTPVVGGGRNWEMGYSFGTGKRIWVVGEKEHIFHYLDMGADVHFESVEAALEVLKKYV